MGAGVRVKNSGRRPSSWSRYLGDHINLHPSGGIKNLNEAGADFTLQENLVGSVREVGRSQLVTVSWASALEEAWGRSAKERARENW